MKEITIDGTVLKYGPAQPIWKHSGYDMDGDAVYTQVGSKTNFYKGEKEVFFKKYLLFGPKRMKLVPIFFFSVDQDIEDCSLSRGDARELVVAAFNEATEKENRCAEIQRGEVI